MVKRVYFIVSSIISILCSMVLILNISTVVDNNINELLTNNLLEASNYVKTFIFYILLFLSIIVVLINLFILVVSYLKKEEKFKWIILACSIVTILFTQSLIVLLFSIGNILVLFFKTKSEIEIKKKETFDKKEVYSLKERIYLSIVSIVLYFVVSIVIDAFGLNYYISECLSSLILMIIMFLLFYKMLKKDFLYFKENYKKYFYYLLKSQVIVFEVYFLSIVALIIIMGGNVAQPANQIEVSRYPLGMLFVLATIYAPFVEELVFRGSLKMLIKNNYLYIFISGLFFGALHVILEPNILNALIMIIPYFALGATFAYFYTKTDNILLNMGNHFIHNFIALMLTILL